MLLGKVFASSSFYAPDHPTVEEQVELARRISHSLVDISNSESKGQSMYENRKKRSVKWVHTGKLSHYIAFLNRHTDSFIPIISILLSADGTTEEGSFSENSTEKVSTPAKV